MHTLFTFLPADAPAWNAFVLSQPSGSVHQTTAWKKLQERIPGRGEVLGFGLKNKKGELLAVTWCVRMEIGASKNLKLFWYYSPRGPVFSNIQAAKELIDKAKKELKKTGALFWRFDPYVASEVKLAGRSATQDYQPTDTLEIDLQLSNEDILAGMKRKGRYNIKLARKKGINIDILPAAKVTSKDIDDFYHLSQETTDRDAFSGHEQSYYEHFVKKLSPYTVLFFAEYKGKRIASAISTFCGPKAIYYFGASTSDPEYRNLMAPYLLQWEMMQYARAQGCTSYDFLGIAPEGEPKHKYAGISEFKWKFGGERKTYAAGREVVFRPLWYLVYRVMKHLL